VELFILERVEMFGEGFNACGFRVTRLWAGWGSDCWTNVAICNFFFLRSLHDTGWTVSGVPHIGGWKCLLR